MMKRTQGKLDEHNGPECLLYERGYSRIAGVDEAGRGPLAGPVVAAAVVLPPRWFHPDITDSKKIAPKKRLRLFSVLQDRALAVSWALAEPQEIDRSNILRASLAAMKKAVAQLGLEPDYVLVDGPYPIPHTVPQTPLIQGDARSLPVAAASIVAKVVRDSIMDKYHSLYPQYHFADNKGYGTRAHLAALQAFGSCPIHRTSFRRVPALHSEGCRAGSESSGPC